MQPQAEVCVNCGFRIGTGENFCPSCGAVVPVGSEFCMNCGADLKKGKIYNGNRPQKSKAVAAILAFLLGGFGVHNFYLGYTNTGIYQILLSFCCGIGWIWALVDFVRILTGDISTDADGVPLKAEF